MTHVLFRNTQQRAGGRQFAVGIVAAMAIAMPAASLFAGTTVASSGTPWACDTCRTASANGTSTAMASSVRDVCRVVARYCI